MSSKKESTRVEIKIANRLPPKEIDKIIEEFGRYGLRADEDIEHFTCQINGRKLFIPKQSEIPFQVNGRIEYVKITDYIRQLLNRKIN